MPPRKNTVGSGEEPQAKVSVEHIFVHTKGSKSSEEVRQPSNQALVTATKDLQHSHAAIWAKVQSLRQRTSTP